MAQLLKKSPLLCPSFTRNIVSFVTRKTIFESIYKTELVDNHSATNHRPPYVGHMFLSGSSLQHFSTSVGSEALPWEGSLNTVLLKKLEGALKDHQLEEAWVTFNDFKNLYGFPNESLMSRLITELSYSSEHLWLQRACDLVFLIVNEKPDVLRPDFMIKLCLSLARAQMPEPASIIFRMMLEKRNTPRLNILGVIFFHMLKSEIGTCLVSNILFELCDGFQQSTVDRSTSSKIVKPDTMIFNLVLDACARFGSSFKGQKIIELMAHAGVIADAHTINIMSRIHEMNGQRDELKKLKDHICNVSDSMTQHYLQFYDSLLCLHFKFNDIDAASELILDMSGCKASFHPRKDQKNSQRPGLVPIGSQNLKTVVNIQILPELMQKDSVFRVETKAQLVMYQKGKILLNGKGIARLIIKYRRSGRISELSKLLISIQKKLGSQRELSLCSDVIDACIDLGWLETAHDILDDMELAGIPAPVRSYRLLLRAYCERNMSREAEAFKKQCKKANLDVKLSDEVVVTLEVENKVPVYSNGVTSSKISELAESFIREMVEEERSIPSVVYEYNASIFFFWKAQMVGDAIAVYRKMQAMNIQPTEPTFSNIVSGYSSLEMYRDITILWGDIKRNMKNGKLEVKRDLCEFLMLNFLRGGYFERVMEIIGHMKDRGMYIDKWILKTEFLKSHKDLYRTLKAANARSEMQSKRIEQVRAFRRWVGVI